MGRCSRYLVAFIISHAAFLASAPAQPATAIPANLAASHVGEYATVEGYLRRSFNGGVRHAEEVVRIINSNVYD